MPAHPEREREDLPRWPRTNARGHFSVSSAEMTPELADFLEEWWWR